MEPVVVAHKSTVVVRATGCLSILLVMIHMNFGLVNRIALVVPEEAIMLMILLSVVEMVAQMEQMVAIIFLVLPIKVQVVYMVVEMVAPPTGTRIIQVFLVRIMDRVLGVAALMKSLMALVVQAIKV